MNTNQSISQLINQSINQRKYTCANVTVGSQYYSKLYSSSTSIQPPIHNYNTTASSYFHSTQPSASPIGSPALSCGPPLISLYSNIRINIFHNHYRKMKKKNNSPVALLHLKNTLTKKQISNFEKVSNSFYSIFPNTHGFP